jgi:hypothetical protein
MEEASVVVVVDEEAKGIEIFEVGSLGVVALLDVAHVLTISKDVVDGVVHRVVEETRDVVLVGTHVCGVTVEALAHLEDACSLPELSPEVFGHLGNGINADAVETIGVNQILDPVLEFATDVGIILVQVGKIS